MVLDLHLFWRRRVVQTLDLRKPPMWQSPLCLLIEFASKASQSPAELDLQAVRESTNPTAARSPSEPTNVQLTSASRVAESSVPDHSLARPPESTDEKL